MTKELIEDFLHELDGWERAYPLSAFPEPDLKRAAELLKAGGMTLDAVSASNMRHVVSCIAPKARATLQSLSDTVERLVDALEAAANLLPARTCERHGITAALAAHQEHSHE